MKRTLASLLIAAALAGCGGGSSNSSNTPPPPPPPPPAATSLTTFVHTELAQTSDVTQADDINEVMFAFPDDDNPAAFDDVLGGP